MGTVYAAHHQLTGEALAIKLIPLRGRDPRLTLERFRREVSISAMVGHPGIVRVQDAGQEGESDLFVVMERLTGEDLEARLKRGLPGSGLSLRIVREALEPLAAAHRAGIVHRDLKPQNIYLDHSSGVDRVKLLDFGIARQIRDSDSGTRSDMGLGTPQYMSPEQATQARQAGPTADVWSMGVVLFRLLEGRHPFEGSTPFNTLKAVCEAPTPPIQASDPLGRRMADIVERCLQKSPTDRPKDAAELGRLLDAAFWESASASLPAPSSTPRPRRRWIPALGVALIAGGSLALAAAMRSNIEPRVEALGGERVAHLPAPLSLRPPGRRAPILVPPQPEARKKAPPKTMSPRSRKMRKPPPAELERTPVSARGGSDAGVLEDTGSADRQLLDGGVGLVPTPSAPLVRPEQRPLRDPPTRSSRRRTEGVRNTRAGDAGTSERRSEDAGQRETPRPGFLSF